MQRREGVVVASVAAVVLAAAAVVSLRWKHRKCESWKEFVRHWGMMCTETSQKHLNFNRGRAGVGVSEGVIGAIGNTPLIRIRSLSEATGCEIYGKCEFLNPGGSVKDRVAVQIIEEALQSGALCVGGVVTEGSAGSTAVSLAMVALAYGCRCHVVIPDDAAIEKTQILESMGATVERVRPVSITHKNHFVNVARRRALEARAANSAPEAQLYAISKQNPHLEEKVDHHVKAFTSEVHEFHAAIHSKSGLPCEIIATRNNSCDSRPAEEEFLISIQKEIIACLIAGVTDSSHVKNTRSSGEKLHVISEEQANAGMSLAEAQPTELHVRDSDSSDHLNSKWQGRGGYFADQFENLANFRAHYEGTGPEIWVQTGGKVDAFVAAAGTGGTIAGVSRYLKEQNPQVKCFLIDPPGSGLYNKVTRGVMYTREEAEGKRMKNPFDTITEGIGINRITENFKKAQLDGAFRGTDKEAVEMARYLMRNDGLFLGSSSSMNCVGAVRVAQMLGPGHTIVTILCDGGARHLSKFHNADYLAAQGLTPIAKSLEFIQPRNPAHAV
ncbi:cysteine synthase 2 [Physcomitrium patens]|uniref:cysteine synthase n=1 Tax=Physcomitrium patens TaxID=3218 RepID=A0A2K1KIT5_PHYPA|nr:cysteine synthase-like [Physcomitrium patens]PNR53692.1 hypothetical protein PHYPA_007367 [Physcomitrium patens]|eukprot:XP_024376683.1 cysteine synthase-like [Physcomitrella patens]